jgi:transcriptional antiterminator RfaH
MYGKRVRTVRIPIFPGYVFLCGTNEHRLAALRTNRVANVLEVPDQDQLRWDLRQICRVVESNEPCALYTGLQRGSRCRVISGSLAGLEGVVLRRRGLSRVYVAVEMIGQSAELEIDAMRLELMT